MPSLKNASHGKYYTIDSNIWKLLNLKKKTDCRGRIHAGDVYYGKEIAVFASDSDQELETCKTFYLLPISLYSEVRKTRGKEKAGEPLSIQLNGDVYTTKKEKYVKIFVKVG
jgi:hypothetical protein